MYTNEEIVEKIRELAKRKNTSLTDIEKNLAWSNGRIGKWKYAKKYPPKQDLELESIKSFYRNYYWREKKKARLHIWRRARRSHYYWARWKEN